MQLLEYHNGVLLFEYCNNCCCHAFFNAAQPALLYIVPFILCSSMLTAVIFGEVKSLMDFEIFDDEEEEEEDKKK